MKHLRNRTFDEYLALCAGFGTSFALLRHAIVRGDRTSLLMSLVLLLPLCLLVAGIDRAKFALSSLFIAFGLYRVWASSFGGVGWGGSHLVMICVPIYLALLFWRWNVSTETGGEMSPKSLAHLKEELRSLGCTIGEGVDAHSFGVGKDGVATLVSASQYHLQFQTMIECDFPNTPDADSAILRTINRLNSTMKIGRLSYEDGKVLMNASLPAHDPNGFTVQSLYLLWLQDVLTVHADSDIQKVAVNQSHG